MPLLGSIYDASMVAFKLTSDGVLPAEYNEFIKALDNIDEFLILRDIYNEPMYQIVQTNEPEYVHDYFHVTYEYNYRRLRNNTLRYFWVLPIENTIAYSIAFINMPALVLNPFYDSIMVTYNLTSTGVLSAEHYELIEVLNNLEVYKESTWQVFKNKLPGYKNHYIYEPYNYIYDNYLRFVNKHPEIILQDFTWSFNHMLFYIKGGDLLTEVGNYITNNIDIVKDLAFNGYVNVKYLRIKIETAPYSLDIINNFDGYMESLWYNVEKKIFNFLKVYCDYYINMDYLEETEKQPLSVFLGWYRSVMYVIGVEIYGGQTFADIQYWSINRTIEKLSPENYKLIMDLHHFYPYKASTWLNIPYNTFVTIHNYYIDYNYCKAVKKQPLHFFQSFNVAYWTNYLYHPSFPYFYDIWLTPLQNELIEASLYGYDSETAKKVAFNICQKYNFIQKY